MKKTLLLLFSALILSGQVFASERSFQDYEVLSHSRTVIAQGVTREEYRLKLRSSNDSVQVRQRITLVNFAKDHSHLVRFEVVTAKPYMRSLQSVREMGKALRADGRILFGINGDFFEMSQGGPLGAEMHKGVWLQSSEFPDSFCLGFDQAGKPLIAKPGLKLSFSAKREGEALLDSLEIDALNAQRADTPRDKCFPDNAYQARLDNHLVLYTPGYHKSTRTLDGGYEVLLKCKEQIRSNSVLQAEVIDIHDERTDTRAGTLQVCQGMPLKEGTMVLSAFGVGMDKLKALKIGDEISLSSQVAPEWSLIQDCLGGGRPDGGPLLIWEGRALPEDTQADDYALFYFRNPRTMAGIREDGSFFFLVADGNQEKALGLSISELRQIALDLGAYTALNLDGGPSSSFVALLGGQLKTLSETSSSKRETPVGNSLFVILKKTP